MCVCVYMYMCMRVCMGMCAFVCVHVQSSCSPSHPSSAICALPFGDCQIQSCTSYSRRWTRTRPSARNRSPNCLTNLTRTRMAPWTLMNLWLFLWYGLSPNPILMIYSCLSCGYFYEFSFVVSSCFKVHSAESTCLLAFLLPFCSFSHHCFLQQIAQL